MVSLSGSQIDALAIAFTVFASLWLLLALLYMATVCLFFRMRSHGQLGGSLQDPAWGRVYLCGSSSYYIPMGWLFRRYLMYQRTGEDRARIAKIRVMEVQERRAAIQILLQQQTSDQKKDSISNTDVPEQAPANRKNESAASGDIEAPTTTMERTFDVNQDAEQSPLDGAVAISTSTPSDEIDVPFDEPKSTPQHRLIQSATDLSENVVATLSSFFTPTPIQSTTATAAAPTATPESHLQCVEISSEAAREEQNEQDASSSSLESLDSVDATTHCPICFGPYTDDRPHFDSPACSHRFHWDCILSWLEFQSHRDCPCCRVELVSEDQIWSVVRKMRRNERKRQKRSTNAGTAIQPGQTVDEDEDDENDEDEQNQGHSTAPYVRRVEAPRDDSPQLVLSGEASTTQIAFDPNPMSSGRVQILTTGSFDLESSASSTTSSQEAAGDRPQDIMRSVTTSQLTTGQSLVRLRSNPVDLDQSVSNYSGSHQGDDDEGEEKEEEQVSPIEVELSQEDGRPTLANMLASSAAGSNV